MLGDIVKVMVDRPLGSYHPENKKMRYPVNYGYIEEIMVPAEEKQEAYILGVDKPVESFTGEIIAIVHRDNDVKEKWVVAPKGSRFTVEQITSRIKFAEKNFPSHLVVKIHTVNIDAEALYRLGFTCREVRNGCLVGSDQTPSAEQMQGLLQLLTVNEEIFFWNFYHGTASDPGAYITAYVMNGQGMLKEANHGWSGNYKSVALDDLVELIRRNWDKDWNQQKQYVNAIEIRKTIRPGDLLSVMKKEKDIYVPDYSVTAW